MSNVGASRWAPIPGWEGFYEVSDGGVVQSVERIVPNGLGASRRAPSRILTQRVDRAGYFEVELHRQGRPAKRRVHHLVLEAFVGPRPQGFVGCHNDGDKLNNELPNLRWDSYAENNRDTVRHGTEPQRRKVSLPPRTRVHGRQHLLGAERPPQPGQASPVSRVQPGKHGKTAQLSEAGCRMTRSGCLLCGGYGNRHDPIAHDAEPTWITCPTCAGDSSVRRGEFDWTCEDCNGDGGMEP